MGLKLYFIKIFGLLRWILHGPVCDALIIKYLVEHRGLLVEKTPTIKSQKDFKVKSQIMH